jgi:hypothetical protein
MQQRLERKAEFIRALAEFLVADQAAKSIQLEMGLDYAKQWAALRAKAPLFGYPTVEEAVADLSEFLA